MSDDRTNEFMSIATVLNPGDSLGRVSSSINPSKKAQSMSSQNSQNNRNNNMSTMKSAAYSELRTFHTSASEISRDINKTSTLLSELTRLVRTRTLFMDDSERVNFLVLQIKSNIENLNGRLEDAQTIINTQKRRLGEKSQAGQEASNIVGQLKEDFVKATTGFKKVLQQRSDWMKEQSERKRDVFGGNKQADNLNFMTTKPKVYGASTTTDNTAEENGHKFQSRFDGNYNARGAKSKLAHQDNMLDLTSGLMMDVAKEEQKLQQHQQQQRHNQFTGEASTSLGMRNRSPHASIYDPMDNNSNEPKTVLTPLEMQRLDEETGNGQMMQLIPDQNYLRERADAMSTVETNIVELGTIFNKLAVMVNEHREVVQRLEDNVNDANRNINLSMDTLADTLASLRTNKALAGKVFGVIVVFIILFVTFFA